MWDGQWVEGLRRGKVNRIWTTYGSEEDKPLSPSVGRGKGPAGSPRNSARGGLVPVSLPGGWVSAVAVAGPVLVRGSPCRQTRA